MDYARNNWWFIFVFAFVVIFLVNKIKQSKNFQTHTDERRINRSLVSKNTFAYKRLLPVSVLFVFFCIVISTLVGMIEKKQFDFFIIFFFALQGFAGYLLNKYFLCNFVDDVYDDGDKLIVNNKGLKEIIPFQEILKVRHSFFYPQTLTLTLLKPCQFGNEITFMPPENYLTMYFKQNPIESELIERIAEIRRAKTVNGSHPT